MSDKVAQQVMLAYGDCNNLISRNLDWRASEFVSRDKAISIMKRYVPSYNDFEPDLLLNLPEDCHIRLAREASVCMYVMTDEKPDARLMKVDEISEDVEIIENNVMVKIWRLWWD